MPMVFHSTVYSVRKADVPETCGVARLMTHDEIQEYFNNHAMDGFRCEINRDACTEEEYQEIMNGEPRLYMDAFTDDYGKKWRAWLGNPHPDIMAATAWEV